MDELAEWFEEQFEQREKEAEEELKQFLDWLKESRTDDY